MQVNLEDKERLKNRKSSLILLPIFANKHGYLNAGLQYYYHSLIFLDRKNDTLSKILKELSKEKFMAFSTIAKTLLKFGIEPEFCLNPIEKSGYYDTSVIMYGGNDKKILLNDLTISSIILENLIKISKKADNQEIKSIVVDLIEKEENCQETLKSQYENLNVKQKNLK